MSVDKLYIEGHVCTMETLNNLPESSQLAEVATKRFTLHTAIFSKHFPLSNFHKAKFVKVGIQYENNEHFYQHKKAMGKNDQQKRYVLSQRLGLT